PLVRGALRPAARAGVLVRRLRGRGGTARRARDDAPRVDREPAVRGGVHGALRRARGGGGARRRLGLPELDARPGRGGVRGGGVRARLHRAAAVPWTARGAAPGGRGAKARVGRAARGGL